LAAAKILGSGIFDLGPAKVNIFLKPYPDAENVMWLKPFQLADPVDRRTNPRVACDFAATFETLEQTSFPGRIADLSRTGAGAVIPIQLAPKTSLFINLTHPESDFRCGRWARLVHTRSSTEGGWIAGFEFDVPLDDEEWHTFTSEALHTEYLPENGENPEGWIG
jgi:PilZ domain-containing protein